MSVRTKSSLEILALTGRKPGGTVMGGTVVLPGSPPYDINSPAVTGNLPVTRLSTTETDATLVARPNGTGGIEFDAETTFSVTDGSVAVDPVTSIVFTGATITDGSGGEADVAIHVHVWNETPSGDISGTNDTFTLLAAPTPPESLLLFNGGLLKLAGVDFVLTSATIVFEAGKLPLAGSTLVANYTT
jgi:hypothetical protein